MDPERGHAENRKIGLILNETDGVKDFVVDEVAWDCLYDDLIGNNPNGTSPDQSRGEGDAGTGYHDFRYRKGADERKHPLSTRMLKKLVAQLTRLITKYSAYDPETGINWPSYQTAIDLVDILNEYLVEIQAELDATPNAVFPHAPKPHWAIFPLWPEPSVCVGLQLSWTGNCLRNFRWSAHVWIITFEVEKSLDKLKFQITVFIISILPMSITAAII